jgi:hypothetical protein
LDRILFLLFAEDKGLVGTNSIVNIVEKWSGADDDYYLPLYEMVNKYFGHLYRGYTYQKTGEVIPQFGGELFAPDELLESLKIDDAILKNDLLVLSKYDFNTDVDVNILGHIFEHSLNEVDDVEAELRGETLDKTKSKRKKDGVFYTPKYITKYIVDNTLGKLCTEKKIELKLDEDIAIFDYQKADGKLNEKGKELYERLNTYKSWLLTVKVCDPACGSGAFLNQALSYFIEEHKFVDDIIAELTNTPLRLFDTDLQILENNIFGVDINDESVEIAKLSMWLRTAQPGRKLSDLSNNIKCGNSLIDDPAVAGDKAFNWEKEFPTVFEKGGFDVVIGNPPYVSHERIDNKDFLKSNFKSHSAFGDLYIYFYELSLRITNTNGLTSLITSNSFLKADYGKPLRTLIQGESEILEIINIENTQIFSDATVNTVILTFSKNKNKNAMATIVNSEFNEFDFNSFIAKNKFQYSQQDLDIESWNLIKPNILKLKRKIKSENKSLEEHNTKIRLGIATGDNNVFIIDELKKNELIEQDNKNSELLKPILRGRDIDRYFYTSPNLYLILTKNGVNVEKDFPVIFDYFNSFGDNFKKRGAKGQHWTNLRACSFFDDFKEEKIIWIELSDNGRFSLCNDEYYLLNSAYFLIPPKDLKSGYLLSLLNSKLIKFYLQQIAATSGVGTLRWINNYVKEFPIPALSFNEQIHFQQKSEKITALINHFNDINYKFQRTLKRKFEFIEINKKLENWYELTYAELILELSKKKIKLSIADEAEWEDYFLQEQQKSLALKTQINQTDKEIDLMVYELYGLTEEEIQIVENS